MTNQIKPKEQKAIQEAQYLLSQNNANAAKEVLVKFARKNKYSQHTMYLLSLSYAMSGELNEALKLATKLVNKDAENIEYLKLLGVIYHGLGKYEQAITVLDRALKINPNDFQALSNIANSLKESHRYDEAEICYKQSLEIQANQPDALTNYGLLMQVNTKIDEAIDLHRKALQYTPGHSNALYNLAYAFNEKGDHESSLQTYFNVIERMPHHVRALCDIAHVFQKLRRPENALPYLQRAVEVAPNDEHVHLNLGITHMMMENTGHAETSFKDVLRINPGNPTAKYYLAIMNDDGSTVSSPDEYVRELFDGYAATFDEQLIGQLQYRTPELIADMVKKHADNAQQYRILDLGCGTGLAGVYLHDLAEHMVGVDLSPKMLKKAEERNIYNELVASGISQYFEAYDYRPNIVVAADVFVYIGDISDIFDRVFKSIQGNGIFVFSTEDTQESSQFTLKDSGRFAHNETYIRSLANISGFSVIDNQKTIIRYEANEPIHGQVYLLKK